MKALRLFLGHNLALEITAIVLFALILTWSNLKRGESSEMIFKRILSGLLTSVIIVIFFMGVVSIICFVAFR